MEYKRELKTNIKMCDHKLMLVHSHAVYIISIRMHKPGGKKKTKKKQATWVDGSLLTYGCKKIKIKNQADAHRATKRTLWQWPLLTQISHHYTLQTVTVNWTGSDVIVLQIIVWVKQTTTICPGLMWKPVAYFKCWQQQKRKYILKVHIIYSTV